MPETLELNPEGTVFGVPVKELDECETDSPVDEISALRVKYREWLTKHGWTIGLIPTSTTPW